MKELAKKYSRLPLPLKAAFWFSICLFVQRGMNIAVTPFFTRLLSKEEFGLVSSFLSCENVFIVVINFSFSKSIMNLCVRYKDKDEILSSLYGLSLIFVPIWLAVFMAWNSELSFFLELKKEFVIALFFSSFFHNIYLCWVTRMQYSYLYKEVIVISFIYSFFSSFGGLLAVFWVSKLAITKIYTQTIVISFVGLYLLIRSFYKNYSWNNFSIWKYALTFCIPLLPHYLSEILLSSSDKIMINSMCGSSEVAVYSLAYSVASFIYIITSAINAAFVPYQYQKISKGEFSLLAHNTNIIIAVTALFVCMVMLFAREIVLIFGGIKYLECLPLITPICLGAYFNYIFQLFARVQEYYEQKHTIVIASVSCAFMNIFLNYFFIKKFGYIAACYTTFFCYFCFCFLHYYFYLFACKKNIGQYIYDIKWLLVVSFSLIIFSIIIRFISNSYIVKYSFLSAIVCVTIWKKDKIKNYLIRLRS